MDKQQYLIDRFNVDTSGEAPYFIKCSRWKELPYVFADMFEGQKVVGAEIGVEQGRFADCLLRKIPNLFLHAIDCWEAYPGYRENMQAKIDDYEQKAFDRLKGKECAIWKNYSMDAVKQFKDNSLDFVYIDGNHEFQQVVNDIAEWHKKVKVGGIVAGHDYTHNDVGYEVTQVDYAVDAWCKAKGIKTYFVTQEGDRCPSWLYVKQ